MNFVDPGGLIQEATPPVDITQLCLDSLGANQQTNLWQITNPNAAGYASAALACQNAATMATYASGSSAGGGSDAVPKVPPGAPYSAAQMAALTAGFNSALQHVADLPCASLFAEGSDNAVAVAQDDLINTTYRLVQLPQGPGAGAQTPGSGGCAD